MTTAEAASILGVTPTRIRAMIAAGRLKAKRVGRDWLITRAELGIDEGCDSFSHLWDIASN